MIEFKPFSFQFRWDELFPDNIGMVPEKIHVTNDFHLRHISGWKDGCNYEEIGTTIYLKNCFKPEAIYMNHLQESYENDEIVAEVYAQLMIRGACVSDRFRNLLMTADRKYGKYRGGFICGRERLVAIWDVVYELSKTLPHTRVYAQPDLLSVLVNLGIDLKRGTNGELFLEIPYGYQSGNTTCRVAAGITVLGLIKILDTFIENSERSVSYTFEKPLNKFTESEIKKGLLDGMLFSVFVSGEEYDDLRNVTTYIDNIVNKGDSAIIEEVIDIGHQLINEDYHDVISQMEPHTIDNNALDVKEKLFK